MKENVAIKVDKVYKEFKLPHEKTHSIKTSIMTRVRGKKNNTVERQRALQDISFDVKEGEFFGIVGRNGSGKSTLLKIIAEIYQPTKGSVTVKGRLVPFIELGVGFNPDLTGRENVYLSASLMGFSKKEIDGMYKNIVEFAELEKFMDQKLKNYSSGMQVRLAFSIATRAEGDILLVDEVLAVGDADFQRKCFSYFRTLKRQKKTVVFVSHDMSSVQQYCDRAILIDNSRLVINDKAAIVASQYSKLFFDKENDDKKRHSDKVGPSGEQRWGDGVAMFDTVKVGLVNKGEQIRIDFSCTAQKDVETPIFGFSIKNQLLSQLIGTNTVRKRKVIDPIKKGQKVQYSWVIQNILADGEYYIDCTIAHDEASTVADRWPDAATLKVYREQSSSYPIFLEGIEFLSKTKRGAKK